MVGAIDTLHDAGRISSAWARAEATRKDSTRSAASMEARANVTG